MLLLSFLWLLNLPRGDVEPGATVDLSGAALSVVRGVGQTLPDGLLAVTPASAEGAMVLGNLPGVPAQQFGSVSWQLHGLEAEHVLSLIWVAREAPGIARKRQLSAAERSASRVELRSEPQWRGRLLRAGLMIEGDMAEPVLIGGLTLEPASASAWASVRDLFAPGLGLTPWSTRSINYQGDQADERWQTPVTLAGLWLGLAVLFLLLLSGRRDGVAPVGGVAALVLFAWGALDVRWQWQLADRLQQTHALHAGASPGEKAISETDAKIVEGLGAIRSLLPDAPARIFVLSDDPGGYAAGRIRWHLLPHRVLTMPATLPPAVSVEAGDYLLLAAAPRDFRYDPETGRLTNARRELPAELKVTVPGFGALFELGGGG